MAEIIKIYRQNVPAMRFIGKKYGDSDRQNGNFSAKWGEWHTNGWFDRLEQATGGSTALRALYEDGDAYVGLMRRKTGDPFQYWIGIFTPSATTVPEGFDYLDFPEAVLGVAWVYGKESEIYGREQDCLFELGRNGHEAIKDSEGAWWFMERYVCPRFTTPDEAGNVVLDVCFYVK